MDVVGKFYDGFVAKAKTKSEQERTKQKTLRGGSAGCLLPNSQSVGNAQEALARFLGFELPKNEIAPFYFEAGFANEAIWQSNLEAAGLKILTDAEDKISSKIGNYPFTGSPDIRILGDDGKPVKGIELKAVCSPSTGSQVFLEDKPKTGHVIQAAIYSHMLQVPYTLIYTSYASIYPHQSVARAYKTWKIEPGVKEFPLQIDSNGDVLVKIGRSWEKTIVNIPGILGYYETIGNMWDNKTPNLVKPRDLDLFGEPKTYGNKPELAYDEFYNKIGVPASWDEYVRRVKQYCNFVGAEELI